MKTNNTKDALNNAKTKETGGKGKTFTALDGLFKARIESAEPKTFSTGSFGIKIQYALEGSGVAGRKAFENIVLVDNSGKPTKYGDATLKRRLNAAGLDSDNFSVPSGDEDFGSLPELHGAEVVLRLSSERQYLGRPTTDVKAVYPPEQN